MPVIGSWANAYVRKPRCNRWKMAKHILQPWFEFLTLWNILIIPTLIWWFRNDRLSLLKNVSYEYNKYKPLGHFSKAMSTDLQAMANIGCTGVMSAAPTSKDPFGVPASRSSMIRLITLSIWRELLNASLASLWSAAKMCGAPIITKANLSNHLTTN